MITIQPVRSCEVSAMPDLRCVLIKGVEGSLAIKLLFVNDWIICQGL